MRVMMKVSIPVEAGNRGIIEGVLPATIMEFVDRFKPEACYFGPEAGLRTGFFVFDLADPSMMPTVTEGFFTRLNAAIELTPVMNLEDMRAGVETAAKKL